MRKVKVNLSELADAFDNQSYELRWYLNTETGEVVCVSGETRTMLDEYLETELEEGEDESAAFSEWLEECEAPDWQKDALREAYEVEMGYGTRFIAVPEQDSHEGYEDMEEFAATVRDKRLQDLLDVALNGKGAFRRFKDVLADHPDERERWFKFKDALMEQRVREWLEEQGLEPG